MKKPLLLLLGLVLIAAAFLFTRRSSLPMDDYVQPTNTGTSTQLDVISVTTTSAIPASSDGQ